MLRISIAEIGWCVYSINVTWEGCTAIANGELRVR